MIHDIVQFVSQYFDTIVLLAVIFFLLVTILVLTFALLKKESALQFKDMDLTTMGITIRYELNKDEKFNKILAENLLLKKEVEILRKPFSNINASVTVIILAIVFLVLFWRFSDLFKFGGKKKPTEPVTDPLDKEALDKLTEVFESFKSKEDNISKK